MPKFKLLVILLLSVTAVRAQYIGLVTGYALPSGTFANKNMARSESGFAQSGYTFGLQVNYKVLKNLGLCVDINHSAMSMDEVAYTKSVQAENPYAAIDVDVVDAYAANTALAGVYAYVPVKKISFQVKFAFGFANLKIPEKRITQYIAASEYTTLEESRSAMAPAFSWGFGVNYDLSNRVILNARVDQVYANTKFDFDHRSNDDEFTAMPLNFYTATLGIGIRIQE